MHYLLRLLACPPAVTQVAVAPQTEFFITASADGHVKFWKKQPQGIEFAKHYKARVVFFHVWGEICAFLCTCKKLACTGSRSASSLPSTARSANGLACIGRMATLQLLECFASIPSLDRTPISTLYT